MKLENVLLSSLVGTIAGAGGYTSIAGWLDAAYRPFSTDMPAWILYAFPTGAVLGGMSSYALASYFGENRLNAGMRCVIVTLLLNFFYLTMFLHTFNLYGFVYAASESGPAFIWSDVLFLYGAFLVITGYWQKSRGDGFKNSNFS